MRGGLWALVWQMIVLALGLMILIDNLKTLIGQH